MKRSIAVVLLASILVLSIPVTLLAKEKHDHAPACDLTRLLPPPPAGDSEQTRAELKELEELQKERTPEKASYALADQEEVVFRFADVLGPDFNAEKCPLTAALFEKVVEWEGSTVDPAKDYWNRPRPFLQDPALKPCVKMSKSGSYPSGHATNGTMMAVLLSDMVPEKRKELFERGWTYCLNRLVGGVHYRSDIEAGRITGTLIAERLFEKKDFRAEMKKAKAELRKVLGLPPTPASLQPVLTASIQ